MSAPQPSPMKGLSWLVMSLLAVNAVWMLRDTTLVLRELDLIQQVDRGEFVAGDEVRDSIEARDGSALGLLLISIATALVWLPWQYRGQRNLHRSGRMGLRFSPGWAVGWWFVPVANLWKPYQTVRELWFRSDPAELRTQPLGWWVIRLWWAVWIAEIVAYSISGSLVDPEDPAAITTSDLIASDRFELVGNVAWAGAAILAIAIVRTVQVRQEALLEAPPLVPARPDAGVRGGAPGAPLPPG